MIKSICAMLLALLLAGYGRAETGAHTQVAGATPAPPTSTASPHVTVLAQQLAMPGLNRQRTMRIYVPPGYANSTKRCPVLYMHDGQNLFDKASALARARASATWTSS